jgi:hypothetical protein
LVERVRITLRYAIGHHVRLRCDRTGSTWRVCARHWIERAGGRSVQYSLVPMEMEADTPAYVADEADLAPMEDLNG